MIFERLRELIAEQFSVNEQSVTPDMSFADDLGADSLDFLEMVMVLEEEFDIYEAEDELLKLATVGEVAAFIADRVD